MRQRLFTPATVSSPAMAAKHGAVSDTSRRPGLSSNEKTLVVTFVALFLGSLIAPALDLCGSWSDRWFGRTSSRLRSSLSIPDHHLPILADDAVPLSIPSSGDGSTCHGPHGRPFHPLSQYLTPSSHPHAQIGQADMFYSTRTTAQDVCTTYQDRYAAVSNAALNVTYLDDWIVPDHQDRDEANRLATNEMQRVNTRAAESKGSWPDWAAAMASCRGEQKTKQALMMRRQETDTWRLDDVLNLRSILAELAVQNDGRDVYDVHIFYVFWSEDTISSQADKDAFLLTRVPREFWSLVTFWSQGDLIRAYPDIKGTGSSQVQAHDPYRNEYMPLQIWTTKGPGRQYEYIWNWEHDLRSMGHWRDVIRGTELYAYRQSPSSNLSEYGSWQVDGLVDLDGSSGLDRATAPGEAQREADLITLNPIFDPRGSGWYWASDIPEDTKGNDSAVVRTSLGRSLRLSGRLLLEMDKQNRRGSSAHCETWPTTIVAQSSSLQGRRGDAVEPLKAVYAPHPIYTFDDDVSPQDLWKKLTPEPYIYQKTHEKYLTAFTFYPYQWGAKYGDELYRAWRHRPRSCRRPGLISNVRQRYQ